MTQIHQPAFHDLFPFLKEMPPSELNLSLSKIPTGFCAFAEGDKSSFIPLLVRGSIRVLKMAESGREIVLYRVNPGETCILLLSSVLSDIPYPATAIVEKEVEAIMVPSALFKSWIHAFPEVQNFVYENLALRLVSVMTLIEEIAFKRMDERLVEFLLKQTSENQPTLDITHEEIATELGTAREVVSRLLKNLQIDQYIELSRGKIRISDRVNLQSMLSSL